MKKLIKKLHITWITVWLVLVALIFSTVVGYATYTGITSLKRVVSTRPGAGILFSSNYMKQGSTAQVSIEYRSDGEFEAGVNPEYNMTVCNFSQGDRATWYTSNDLKYYITARLLLNEKYTSEDIENGADPSLLGEYKNPTAADIGSLKFGIKYSSDVDYTYFSSSQLSVTLPSTGSYSLDKTEASTDTFSLLFDRAELQYDTPRFWIQVTATPTSVSGAEVETLSGYVGTCKSAVAGANWLGFIDDENYETIDYDSYNYVIAGNGKGSFYFAWDDSKVKPNEFALQNYSSDIQSGTPASVSSWTNYNHYGSGAPTSGAWKYIELSVDSDSIPRYEIQLYKTNGDDFSPNISSYVDYYFVADTE